MHRRSLCAAAILVILMIAGMCGCSGGGKSPVLPNLAGTDVEITKATNGQPAEVKAETSRNLWGLWTLNVNADHTAIEVVPVRDAQFHLNVTGYLENPPGNLKITNVSWSAWGTLLVDIQLKHPFKSNPTLTGFDVRGIAILPATKIFPSTIIMDVDGDPSQIYASRGLVNADGYTTLWNRETAKPVEYPKIFGYIRGKMATKNEIGIKGNLHGFRAYWTDPIRRIFQSNENAVRTYEFDFPPGPLSFAYAVDACWEPPDKTLTGDPGVLDVPGDFPISANCAEPYQISTTIVSNTLTKVGGSATVQFEVFDWQDATAFSHVHVEAPDLFYGTLDPGSPINVGINSSTFEIVIPNSKGDALTANGGSDLLVVVEDTTNSTINPDLTAYNIFKLPVADVPAFWRDRHGDGSFVNVPLAVPLIEPSTLSTGMPDLAVVSYPEDPYALFNEKPEIMLFDDNGERFIVYDRDLNSTSEKAGYPLSPGSWLLYPKCMDATLNGYFGVGSTSSTTLGGGSVYEVKNAISTFKQSGVYTGTSWHTGTYTGGADSYLELIKDVTNDMGNVPAKPLFALFGFDSGTPPGRCNVLSVGYPYYKDATGGNTFRTYVPRSGTSGVPGAIFEGAERLRIGADTYAKGLAPLHMGFYVLESYPSTQVSEVEGFDINFLNFAPAAIWRIGNADIQAEFPGAWAVDTEVVPSRTNNVTTFGDQVAQYNWLCVLMQDTNHYWLAFYDPLNPSPDNPGHNIHRSIYTSNKIPLSISGLAPVAVDIDFQFFEAYVLLEDSSENYYMSVFEYFY